MDEIFWIYRRDEDLGTLAHPGKGPFRTLEQARVAAREVERKDEIPRYIVATPARLVPEDEQE